MAAELIDGGIDVHAIYRRLYEGIPQGKLELLARGLSNVQRYDGGLLTVTHLTLEDYRSTGADESYSEGVVDHLRSVEGTAVAGLVRDLLGNGASPEAQGLAARHRRPRRRLARSPAPRAAAATAARRASRRTWTSRSSWSSSGRALSEQLVTDGVVLVDKPAGVTSHDVVAAQRRRLGRGVKVGHAGTLDPFATGLLLVLVGRATRVQRFLMALPQALRDRGAAGVDVDHRRPGGRDRARARCRRAARAPDGHDPPAPAGVLGGQGRRAARLRAGAPRRGGRDPRARGARVAVRPAVARRRAGRVRDRLLVRAPTCGR